MIPFAIPPAETHLPISAIIRSMYSQQDTFSKILKNHLGAEHCVLAANARTLLYLLLCNLCDSHNGNLKNEVLLPGYTCYSVPAAVVKAGYKVNLYDLDPQTFQPDFDDIRRKINSATVAVIGQHLLGVMANIEELADLAREKDIICIEDSAQFLPSNSSDGSTELFADFALYSFGRGKPLPLGGGGALVAKTFKGISLLEEKIGGVKPSSSNCLIPLAVQVLSHPRIYWALEKLPFGLGETIFNPNFEVAAMSLCHRRLGAECLSSINLLNDHRVIISKIYNETLGSKAKTVYPYIRYPIFVKDLEENSKLARLGVRYLYPNVLCQLQPLKKSLNERSEKLPGAIRISKELITLPTHLGIDEKIAKYISQTILENTKVSEPIRM